MIVLPWSNIEDKFARCVKYFNGSVFQKASDGLDSHQPSHCGVVFTNGWRSERRITGAVKPVLQADGAHWPCGEGFRIQIRHDLAVQVLKPKAKGLIWVRQQSSLKEVAFALVNPWATLGKDLLPPF